MKIKRLMRRMIKKINKKLKNDSTLFFKDMIKKYLILPEIFLKKFTFKKHRGNYNYSVVSAVYNVEKYLDYYFKSLTQQKLNFKNNIHLIMVDDGSTDSSASIIKEWQSKYPENITYIYKDNGGQASARNVGMLRVKTPYVTFIDPDDFIDLDYFLKVDAYLYKNRNKDIQMAGCNFIFYYEDLKVYKDSHPLNNKFMQGNKIVYLKNLDRDIQLSAASAIFLSSLIKTYNLTFDEQLKPRFEDAKFIGDYLQHLDGEASIAFIAKAIYYYRKREDGTSTLNGSWKKAALFGICLERGALQLLKNYSDNRVLPEFIKNTVLYHLGSFFKYLINKPERVAFLTQEQKKLFLDLLDDIFSYIDKKSIVGYDPSRLWIFHKVGILGCFKNEKPDSQIIYIRDIDAKNQQVCLKYFTSQKVAESVLIDGVDVIPDFIKTMQHNFVDRIFVYEQRMWIHVPLAAKQIEVLLDGKQAKITYGGKWYRKLNASELHKAFANAVSHTQEDIWLLIDRDIQADDNAEHLYRYIVKKHPEKHVYFALRSSSHDWERLKSEGFNLLDFGTLECDKILKKSTKIISSHINDSIVNYFGKDTLKEKDFVFLRHGIVKDDMSNWLNSKKIDCLLTTTKDEYDSIAGDFNHYRFSKKEVVLTGLPRHDSLLTGNNKNAKTILIMPTWRRAITGSVLGETNQRSLNPDFLLTDYARYWLSFLKNPLLKNLAKKYAYKLVYFPHVMIQPYLPQLHLPNYIDVLTHSDTRIQELFQQSAFMITDYSSVAFEMGLLNKTVLYYQFDEADFFSGSHIYQKGYFDYRTHGFGPVVIEEDQLFLELETILRNGGKSTSVYTARIEKTFTFRDQDNCKRAYEAIIKLDAIS